MTGHGNFDYSGESAIITGATKGIGRGIAESLAQNGANVAINARTAEDIDEAVSDINANSEGKIVGIPGDVGNKADIENLVEVAIGEFGSIDLLVNNAAMWPREESMIKASIEDWKRVMNVNVRSQFYSAKLVAEHMISGGIEGNIINVTSHTGGRRCGGRGLYGASNTAINGLTWRMAYDYAQHGIRVNAISTYVTMTHQVRYEAEMISEDNPELSIDDVLEDWGASRPLERLGKPSDLGNAVLFLASDRASYVAGHILRVSGGGNLQGSL
jgi:NAD(P)-dependent dehydrogenase (short-subunit alcohol dehydrogenase family)